MENNWSIEHLINLAFKRTKERFVSYFLGYVLSFAMMIGVMLLLLVGIGITVFVGTVFKSAVVTGFLGLGLLLLFILFVVYLGTWLQLAIVDVLISEKKPNLTLAIKNVKPYVWSYIHLSVLGGLFILGLFPLGMLTLGIILILWGIWNSFTIFIFLHNQPKGLSSLWLSRQIVNQRFWGIVGRTLLVSGAIFVFQFMLIMYGQGNSGLVGFISFLISLFSGPFIISFNYEMFKNLSVPSTVQKPTGWIVISTIGLIIMFLALVFTIYSSMMYLPQALENMNLKSLQNKKQLQDVEKFNPYDLNNLEKNIIPSIPQMQN